MTVTHTEGRQQHVYSEMRFDGFGQAFNLTLTPNHKLFAPQVLAIVIVLMIIVIVIVVMTMVRHSTLPSHPTTSYSLHRYTVVTLLSLY
jgi:hypothetical protein